MPTVKDSRSTLATDPLRNFRFQVNIPHTTPSGQKLIQLGFMTLDGLNLETQVVAYREGGFNTALPLTAPVLTTSGWKKMGELQVGDSVIDPRGERSYVKAVLPAGVKDIYEVTLADGSKAVACWGHLWEVDVQDTNRKRFTDVISTIEMKALVDNPNRTVRLPKIAPVEFDVQSEPLPLDPYLLGVLLAEGSFTDTVTLASTDEEVLDRVRAALPSGHSLIQRSNGTSMCKYAISVGNDGPGARNVVGRNKVMAAIRDLGLFGHRAWEKFIPEQYLRASVQNRIDLLRGFMDGDGSCTPKGNVRFATSSDRLAEGMQELIRSLGGRCRVVKEPDRTYAYKGSRVPCRDVYWVNGVSGLEFNPFHLSRKAECYRVSQNGDARARRVVSVEHVGVEEVQCIEVSASSHLYISHDYVVSHNTTQKMPGQSDFTPLTMTTGVIVSRPHAWDWIREIFAVIQGTGPVSTNFRTDLQILVMAHPYTSNPVPAPLKFKVYNAWPSSFGVSGLDAGGNAVLLEQMVLQHEGWEPIYANAWNGDVSAA